MTIRLRLEAEDRQIVIDALTLQKRAALAQAQELAKERLPHRELMDYVARLDRLAEELRKDESVVLEFARVPPPPEAR